MAKIYTRIVAVVLFALATSTSTSILPVRAESPDFSIASTPISTCISQGATASFVITVSGLGGFEGSVMLDDSIDPNTTNGPALSSIPSSVSLANGQNSTFDLTVTTSLATSPQVYSITIDGLSGLTVHSVAIYFAFQPLCDTAGGAIIPENSTGAMLPLAGIVVAIMSLGAGTAILLYIRRKP